MTPEEQEAQKEDWAIKDGARQGALIGAAILFLTPLVFMLYSFIRFLAKGIFKFLVGNVGDVFKKRKK